MSDVNNMQFFFLFQTADGDIGNSVLKLVASDEENHFGSSTNIEQVSQPFEKSMYEVTTTKER